MLPEVSNRIATWIFVFLADTSFTTGVQTGSADAVVFLASNIQPMAVVNAVNKMHSRIILFIFGFFLIGLWLKNKMLEIKIPGRMGEPAF